MTQYDTVHDWIEAELPQVESPESHHRMVDWFLNHGHTYNSDLNSWPRTSEVEEAVEHMMKSEVTTVLGNLKKAGILTLGPRGGSQYIRNHRTEENFFDVRAREWVPHLDDEIQRFLEVAEESPPLASDGGTAIREVALEAIDSSTSSLRHALTEVNDDFDRLDRYDKVVAAIERSDEIEKDDYYGAMGLRNVANTYALSEQATRMMVNNSLSDYEGE